MPAKASRARRAPPADAAVPAAAAGGSAAEVTSAAGTGSVFGRVNDDVAAVILDFLPFEVVLHTVRRASRNTRDLVARLAADAPLVRVFAHLKREVARRPVVDCGRFLDPHFGYGSSAGERIGRFAECIGAAPPPDFMGLLRGIFDSSGNNGAPRWPVVVVSLPSALQAAVKPWLREATKKRGRTRWHPRPGDPVPVHLSVAALKEHFPVPSTDTPLRVLRAVVESGLVLRPQLPDEAANGCDVAAADPSPFLQALVGCFEAGAAPIRHGSDARVVLMRAGTALLTQVVVPIPSGTDVVITGNPATAFMLHTPGVHVRCVHVTGFKAKSTGPQQRQDELSHTTAPASLDMSELHAKSLTAPMPLEAVDLPPNVTAIDCVYCGSFAPDRATKTLDLRHLQHLKELGRFTTSATVVKLPMKVLQKLHGDALRACPNLKEVDWRTVAIPSDAVGPRVLSECATLRRVVMPACWGCVPSGFCSDCPALSDVPMAHMTAVTAFELAALRGAASLRRLELPPTVRYIRNGALHPHGAGGCIIDASACREFRRFDGSGQPFVNVTLVLPSAQYARMADVVEMPSRDKRDDASGLRVQSADDPQAVTDLPVCPYDGDIYENDYPDRYQHNWY